MRPGLIKSFLTGIWAMEYNTAQAYYPVVLNTLFPKYGSSLLVSGNVQFEDPKFSASTITPYNRSASDNGNFSNTKDKVVAVIPLKGAIIKYDEECGQRGTETITTWFRNAVANENVAAIILDVDSGGGSGDAVQLLSSEIKNSKKPVIAYVGNGMAASAAYWIASACKEIYATFKTDEIGSIGTYVTLADFKKYYESEGLPIIEVYATESTEKNKLVRMAFEGNTEPLQKEYVDPFNTEFQNTIKTNRAGKLNLTGYPDILKGKLYNAEDATKAGLIDGLKSFDEVVARAFELANSSSSNKNSTNTNTTMKKFEKTAALLGVEAFESSKEGVHMSEANMQAIEDALVARETAEASLAASVSTQTKITEELTAANATVSTQAARIAELEAEVKTLGSGHPGIKGNAISKEKEGATSLDTEKYPSLKATEGNPLFN